MKYVAWSIRNLPEKVWTSIELNKLYKENRGEENKRSKFLSKLMGHMKNELYVFTSPGLAGIIMLEEKAYSMFKIVSEDNNDYDDDDVSMQSIANRIKKENKEMTKRKTKCSTINTENLFDACSNTPVTFSSKLSTSFDKSSNAEMIGAIVTSVLTNSFTQLQLAVGILVHDEKLIEYLHKYSITTTYHEVRRYKIAAVESDDKGEELQSSDGLIQVVSGNFDAHIYSQNGLIEKHSLATIITQPQSKPS